MVTRGVFSLITGSQLYDKAKNKLLTKDLVVGLGIG